MENQQPANLSENTSQEGYSQVIVQQKTSLIAPILLAVLVSAAIFGLVGYFLGKQSPKITQNTQQAVISPTPYITDNTTNRETNNLVVTVSPIQQMKTTPVVNKPSGWQTYSNAAYSYAISFPSTWKAYDQASGPGVSVATPRSGIVDIIDSTLPKSIPYPSEVIVLQHYSEVPSLYSSWTRSDKNINGIPTIVYENADEAIIVYIFTAPEASSFMELRFNASKEVPTYKTFEQIASTFKFNL